MRPSELFSGVHVPVVCGLAPELRSLEAKVDGETQDDSIPMWQSAARDGPVPVWRHQQVQDAVLKFLDLCRKDETGIPAGEFHGIILRFLRIYLPGLSEEQEQRLCENSWQEACQGCGSLNFSIFFRAMVRLAQSWSDSNDPEDFAGLLQELLSRSTAFESTDLSGQVRREPPQHRVRFRAAQRGDDLGGTSDFSECLELVCSGDLDAVKVEVLLDQVPNGINYHSCFFEEFVALPQTDLALRRVWLEVAEVWPLGYAALRALHQMERPEMVLNCSGKKGETIQAVLELLHRDEVLCEVSPEQVVCEGQAFSAQQFFGAVQNDGMISSSFLLKPDRMSFLHKLSSLRESLLLPSSARLAAETMGAAKPPQCLPTFPDLLSGAWVVEPAVNSTATPEQHESLIDCGSLSSVAEAFLVHKVLRLPGLDSALEEPEVPEAAKAIYDSFTAQFPKDAEGLIPNDEDLINLARTSPLALWVFGQCDSGAYKTEACRRLADKLQLQWLQPAYVLELATKTPAAHRSPLQRRCVEQLQRGMTVSVGDALRLTMEMMSSALCKANGYILDFPAVTQEELPEVLDFFGKVKELSGKTEVPWGEVLEDTVELPALAPEPEPPKPPEEAEAEAEKDEAEAEAEEPKEAKEAKEAKAEDEGEEGEAKDGEPKEGEGEAAEAAEVESPPEAPAPNCWANILPRRMVMLAMAEDNVDDWRQETSKRKHQEEKERIRKLEEAGEEVPEEGEEEAEEPPQMPEEEEEQKALFDKTAGDQLQAMAPFLPLPELDPKRLPPLPEEKLVEPETVDREAMVTGEAAAVEAMRKQSPLPLLSLKVDGRTPTETAELMEVLSGFGGRVGLPAPLEGAAEPKELLRLNLETGPDRRWSPWRLHCPVSLHEKQLAPGAVEFAVDYAGYVFLFAGEEQMRRFCQWPKRYLTDLPRINVPGLALGFVLLSPGGFRCQQLAKRLEDTYGFQLVSPLSLLQRALAQPPVPDEPAEEALPPVATEPWLYASEHQELRAGKAASTATCLRLIGWQLGIEKNLALLQKQVQALEEAKKLVEEAQAAGTEPEGLTLDEEGQPMVELEEPLARPQRGFVLQGFPESAEQLEALKQLGLNLDQVLLLQVGEEADVTETLQSRGLSLEPPQTLENQLAAFEGLRAVDGLRLMDVALEVDEEEQFAQIRKHIDPFYEVVEDETMAAEIPDPEEWTPEEVEDGAEPAERPVISWGCCGPYCPVTLKERWLYPGQKDFQHVYRNKVFALANEAASQAFVKEPVSFVPTKEPALPPPRILITGPTGSGVAKQCEMLSEVYKIPVLKLEEIWRTKVQERLERVKDARKEQMRLDALLQPMLEDDKPLFPEGWVPQEEKPADPEEEEGQAPEPEEDGLDDEQREELFVQAMKDALGPHCGACILDGTWFGDLADEEMAEEIKAARSLPNLLTKAKRLPDLTVVLKCRNDLAAKNTFDFEAIDKDYEERLVAYQAQVTAAEAKEEDPPEAPEGLVVDGEEKESERVKARFVEQKAQQQQLLKDLAEALQAARAPFQKVSSDRGDEPTHKAVRFHCRPFVEHRSSMLMKHQVTKAAPALASDLLRRGLARPSRFSSPRPDSTAFCSAVLRGRIYYFETEEERAQFMERPAEFLSNPGSSVVAVRPAVCVLGGPLSGKTNVAKQLATRTGAVYISVPEVLSGLSAAVPWQLSKDIAESLRRQRLSDDQVIQALRFRLLSPDVLQRGWVLDDFPCTVGQAEGLAQLGVVPHQVLVLDAPEAAIFSRCQALTQAMRPGTELQQELALQRERLEGFRRHSGAVRVFYSMTFGNLCDIDASRSSWAIFDRALQETQASCRRRSEYYRRTAQGLAAKVAGMAFPATRLKRASAWKQYCPVTLALANELMPCYDPNFAVEHKSKVYWTASAEYAELFAQDPEAFLQVPLPKTLPKLLDDGERTKKNGFPVELGGFCPVMLVEKGQLQKGSRYFMVEYNSCLYRLTSREACAKFLRRPLRFSRAKLPQKLPPEVSTEERQASHLLSALVKGKDGRGLQPSDMVTYMQASVAELICQGLVDCGERRPLFPGKGPRESAQLCLARFLRARNALNTEIFATAVTQAREDFLQRCALPFDLKEMTEKKVSPDYVWTSTEDAKFQELCARFDEVFCK